MNNIKRHPLTRRQQQYVEDLLGEWNGRLIKFAWFKYPRMVRVLHQHGHAIDDIEQLCRQGACWAASSFRPELGHEFSTYAGYGIRSAMGHAITGECQQKRRGPRPLSGDDTGPDPDGVPLWEFAGVAAPEDPDFDPVGRELQSFQRDRLTEALRFLDPRSQRILSLRYGLEDGVDRTLTEVGRLLGITRERVRQLEAKAMKKVGERLATRQRELVS